MRGQNFALGALIKINRIKKKISQAALAKGICATSYLSKIENGEIAPNEETVGLLLGALGIRYYQEEAFTQEEAGFFAEYSGRVFGYDIPGAADGFARIKDKRRKFLYSPFVIEYLLVSLHGLFLDGKSESKKAQDIRNRLVSVRALLEDDQQVFYCYLQSKLSTSLEDKKRYLKRAIEIAPHSRLFYELAYKYFGAFEYHQALEAADNVLKYALEEGSFRGIVFANNLYGEIYTLMNDYETAEGYYNRNIKLLHAAATSDSYVLSFIYYAYVNKAILAFLQKDYNKMLEHCRTAQQHESGGGGTVYGLLHYLLTCEYYFRQGDKAMAGKVLKTAAGKKNGTLTADKNFEHITMDLYEYRLRVDDYLSDKGYLRKLKAMKQKLQDDGAYHCLHFVQRYLVEYYVANKKYKDAFLILENMGKDSLLV